MKKFILLLTFFTLFMGTKNANAQAIYGPTTVCMDQVDGAGQPRAVTTYTVNHPLLCDYCKRGYNVEYTVQSGGTASEFLADCSTSGQIWNRVTTLTIVWTTPGTHVFTVGWKSCGVGYQGSSALSISVNVSNGIVNTSGNLAGTITNTALYPEPYVCSNNLSNFNINTDLSIGSCAASVSNQTLYLDRLNSTTGVWAQSVASATLPAGSSTRNMATIFGASNFTGVNNLNIYRVRGSVTSSAAGTKTFTTPNFRVVSIGAYNVDYFYTNTQGTNIAIPSGNLCTSPLPVSKFDAPVISGTGNSGIGGNSGIIDKYWVNIYDVTTNCQNNVATLNAFDKKRTLITRSLAEINGLNLETYYRQIKQAQGVPNPDLHIFSNNPNRIWKIELWGENICTGTTGIVKTSFIVNNCLNCRSVGSVDMTKRTIKGKNDAEEWVESATVYPNPANKIAIIEYVSNEEANANLVIYDMQGRVISEQKSTVIKGENKISIDISAFTNGMYAFKIGNISGKFVKE